MALFSISASVGGCMQRRSPESRAASRKSATMPVDGADTPWRLRLASAVLDTARVRLAQADGLRSGGVPSEPIAASPATFRPRGVSCHIVGSVPRSTKPDCIKPFSFHRISSCRKLSPNHLQIACEAQAAGSARRRIRSRSRSSLVILIRGGCRAIIRSSFAGRSNPNRVALAKAQARSYMAPRRPGSSRARRCRQCSAFRRCK